MADYLKVTNVSPDGAIFAWNRMCVELQPPERGPTQAICEGDLITSVNDKGGSKKDMLELLKTGRLLKFMILRRL